MNAIQSFRAFRKATRDAASSASYEAAFRAWAWSEVDRMQARHPGHSPFRLDTFDGCTFGLDISRPCCLAHDLACHFSQSADERRQGDAEFFDCVSSVGRDEDRFGGAWKVIGWGYWAAVRAQTEWLALTGKL